MKLDRDDIEAIQALYGPPDSSKDPDDENKEEDEKDDEDDKPVFPDSGSDSTGSANLSDRFNLRLLEAV